MDKLKYGIGDMWIRNDGTHHLIIGTFRDNFGFRYIYTQDDSTLTIGRLLKRNSVQLANVSNEYDYDTPIDGWNEELMEKYGTFLPSELTESELGQLIWS